MEAEEIISSKEWSELNASDKEILSDLVADEQEYNLLKKMMQVSAEMPDAVPAVNPSVQQSLINEMKPVRSIKSWYRIAVAAAIVLFTAGLLFVILRKETKEPEIVKTIPAIQKDSVQPLVRTIVRDTLVNELLVSDATDNKTSRNPIVKKNIPVKKAAPVFKNLQTDISADSSLLAFVSEVY
ncbi:MAG: hypothetical protein V9E88_13735 [Ferruginibacter sp.]